MGISQEAMDGQYISVDHDNILPDSIKERHVLAPFLFGRERNYVVEMGVARVRFRNEIVKRKTFTFEKPFAGKPKVLMTGAFIRGDIPSYEHQFNGMEAERKEWCLDINFNECQGYRVRGFTTFVWIAMGPKASTSLESSIRVEQSGPMQITVRKGYFIDMQGNKYELKDDQVIDFSSDSTYDKEIYVALVKNITTEEVDIWVDDRIIDGFTEAADVPDGWEVITPLVGRDWLIIPAGTADIKNVEKRYLAIVENKPKEVEF